MAVALWRSCDKSCIVWGDCVSTCVCISSWGLKSTWPFSRWGCWKLLGHYRKHPSPVNVRWGAAWLRGVLVLGNQWKYDSHHLEQTTHCCATAFQQVLVSFWYLMDKEILLSATRLALLSTVCAKKQRVKRSEGAWSLNLSLCWVIMKVKLRHITRQQEGTLAYCGFCFANKQWHLLITVSRCYPSHVPGSLAV